MSAKAKFGIKFNFMNAICVRDHLFQSQKSSFFDSFPKIDSWKIPLNYLRIPHLLLLASAVLRRTNCFITSHHNLNFFSSSTSTVINISFCFRFREERDESFFTYLHNDDIYSDYAFIAALLTLMSYRICLFFRHNANFFFLSLFYQRLANSQRTVQISSSQALKMSTKLCLNVSASLSRERKSDSATKTVKDPRMIHFSGIICRIRDRWCWWTIFCLCWC